ncbi:hypothetical protein RYZ27_02380 [Hyphomonas sp. FCG-A18]|uniref:hypothetical protein n=1 Tax=Hyphomonas sp. FCG-A18 TaxID=3080019 RepID=UPI002B31BA75|nr:hypothetical protein RYZ27_02380 [Hyphomonas sp. FCG-A18]
MSESLANIIVTGFGVYLLIGLLVGFAYMFGGAGKIDPAAKGKGLPLRVRLLILPGIIGLWPMMLTKLLTQTEPPIS